MSSSDTSSGSTSAPSLVSFGRRQLSFGLSDHSWPSIATTDTDLTTPSLCSDNENDGDAEVVLLPTPPRRPPTPPRRFKRQSNEARTARSPDVDRLPEIIDIIDVDAQPEAQSPVSLRVVQNRAIIGSPPARTAQLSSSDHAFAKRPPTSPLPKATPKKPLPPARIRQRPVAQSSQAHDVNNSNITASIPKASTSRYNPLSSIPVASRKKKAKNSPRSSKSHPKEVFSIQLLDYEPDSAHTRRRRTLDDELRRAGDHLWQDQSDEMESGLLVATGSMDNNGGFLARGGGAGSPVFMGSGYVQGFGSDDRVQDGRTSDRHR